MWCPCRYMPILRKACSEYPLPLLLNVQTFEPGPGIAGIYTGFDQKISLHQVPFGSSGTTAAQDYSVTAHEYGHYIHHRYGYNGHEILQEAWAEHNVFRFARYMNDFGGWSLGYSASLGASQPYRHGQTAQSGEYVIDPLGHNAANFYENGPACSGMSYDKYTCGQPFSLVYWELAWNFCRLGYLACSNQQAIVQGGSYSGSPWALTNSAFAYAISMVGSVDGIDDFMLLVADRYAQFVGYGFLTTADLLRVQSVLAHHCLGPQNKCGVLYHRLPASPLANRGTHKQMFAEAEDNAPSGTIYVSEYLASNGAHVGLNAPTSDPNRFVRFSIDTLSAGQYKIRPLVYKAMTGSAKVYWRVDMGAWKSSFPSLAASYDWSLLESVALAKGTHTIDVRVEVGHSIWIDGLKLEQVL